MVIFKKSVVICRRAQARWNREFSDLPEQASELLKSFAIYDLSYLSLISRLTTTEWTAILTLQTWNRTKQVKYGCLYYLNRSAKCLLTQQEYSHIKSLPLWGKLQLTLMPFFVQLLLNDNSSILQLKIKGPLTPLSTLVLSNEGPIGLLFPVIQECINNSIVFPCYGGFVFILPIFYECSRGQISQVTMIHWQY